MSIIRSSAITIAGVFIANVLAYLFHFVAARKLGPAAFGDFGALMSFYMLLALPALSLNSTMAKFAARHYLETNPGKTSWLRRKISLHVFIFSFVLLILFLFFSKTIIGFLHLPSVISVWIVGVSISFCLLLQVHNGILLGKKEYTIFSGVAILESLARLLLLLIFLFFGLGYNGAILAYGSAYLVALLSISLFLHDGKQAASSGEEENMNQVYRFLLHVLLANLGIQLLLNAPLILIKHYYSSETTGYWNAALNLSKLSVLVSTSISQIIFTEVASLDDIQRKKAIKRKAIWLTLLATTAIAVLFYIFSDRFVILLFGAAYAPSTPILQGLGFAMIALGLLQLWINFKLADTK